MPRTFAIGDIHGCHKTFRKLILEEIRIQKEDTIYCVGDYIDRGPDSKGVIDFILRLREEGYTIHTLRGNHEEVMLKARTSFVAFNNWIGNGGDATLLSFGVFAVEEMGPKYLDFFEQTKFYIEDSGYIYVHAGLNFSEKNPLTDKVAMLWTRDNTANEAWLNGRTIIHGHTPISLSALLAQPVKGSVNIDNGCVKNHKPGLGHLVALNVTEKKFITVANIE